MAALLLVTALTVPFLGEEFLPSFREYDFLMHWVEKPGASIEAMRRAPNARRDSMADLVSSASAPSSGAPRSPTRSSDQLHRTVGEPRAVNRIVELQGLVDELGFPITVCHLPPGTSKWNKIEHRLFSFITQNWRGKPLITHQVIVNLIAATTTAAGLAVRSRLDDRLYAKGRRVSDQQLACVNLEPHAFHGEWNYTIHPTTTA